MTSTNVGIWRHAAPCLLTFVIGIAITLAWQGLPSLLVLPESGPPPQIDRNSAPTSGAWMDLWALIAMAGLALIAIGASIRWATVKPANHNAEPVILDVARQRLLEVSPVATELGPAEVEKVRDQVELQLAELVGYVSRYLDTTSDQAAVFATAQTSLAGAGTVEQVQEVIKLLIANNSTARKSADDLRARLVEAQTESAELQASLRKAEALATVDGLTNLPNRRRFQESLEEHVATCHREHTPLCLVLADLDHFKAINDKFGHPSGDAVLKAFARVLSNGVRSTDIAARYGGEEFALILPKTPLGSASVVAESLRRAVAETVWTGATPKQRIGRVTASFGVAEIREDESVESLIDRADQKLYEAKHKGRNRVVLDHTVPSQSSTID